MEEFGAADLGDARRSRRLVELARRIGAGGGVKAVQALRGDIDPIKAGFACGPARRFAKLGAGIEEESGHGGWDSRTCGEAQRIQKIAPVSVRVYLLYL